MAHSEAHHDSHDRGPEKLELGSLGNALFAPLLIVGAIAMVAAVVIGRGKDPQFRHFYFAYLVAFSFVLSLAMGGLFFVLLQYLTKAGWSVTVRRVAEWMAGSLPLVGIMAVPIIIAAWSANGVLYKWSDPNWGKPQASAKIEGALKTESVSPSKRTYLSPPWFTGRMIGYFLIWSIIGVGYARASARQDTDPDPNITARLQSLAAPSLVICALTITLASFDLLMSLDPSWSSTMFGVYYFAGCMLSFFALAILIVIILQSQGYLTQGISVEHCHDLGKFLFAFVFFFGYVGFSQYMLMWYANIPEETEWFLRRGVSTAPAAQNGYTLFALMVLFGQVLIPFAGLLSRHVKRNPAALAFWAGWLLFFHWIDIYWLVTPEFGDRFVHLGALQLLTTVGLFAIFLAVVVRRASSHALRPLHDPRLPEALAFHNI